MENKAHQLRIYQIKKGKMAEWLEFFRDTLLPLHDRVNLPVIAAWRNVDQENEFIWIRSFKSVDTIEEQEKAFFSQPDRIALGDVRGTWLDGFKVRVIESHGLPLSS